MLGLRFRRQANIEPLFQDCICITFVQCRPNVFDVGPTLYKCYTNVLCLLVNSYFHTCCYHTVCWQDPWWHRGFPQSYREPSGWKADLECQNKLPFQHDLRQVLRWISRRGRNSALALFLFLQFICLITSKQLLLFGLTLLSLNLP